MDLLGDLFAGEEAVRICHQIFPDHIEGSLVQSLCQRRFCLCCGLASGNQTVDGVLVQIGMGIFQVLLHLRKTVKSRLKTCIFKRFYKIIRDAAV